MINTFDYTLKKLIVEKDYLFQVPNYQRSFVWTEKEVLQFVRDGYFCMQKYKDANNKFEHYAGQMIFRSMEKRRDGKERMEIIDGQQRLTTFEILVIAIIDVLKLFEENLDTAEKLRLRYLLSEPVSDKLEKDTVLCLSKKEQRFWHSLMDGIFLNEKKIELKLESQKRIWKAYVVIKEYFILLTNALSADEQKNWLLSYIKALEESFRVVVLITENSGHEFALFQIVNDRGVPLTPGELLKARTIELLTSQDKELRRERLARRAEEIWEDILSDSGVTTESYLVWNYMAILGKVMGNARKSPINEQYEQNIFGCFDKREISLDMQDHMLDQLEQLHENVELCRELEAGRFPIKGANANLNLLLGILVKNMRNKTCIPLYLKILAVNREKTALMVAEALTGMLIKTYFMAKVMGNVNDESIMNCYLEIWSKIGENSTNMDDIKVCLEKFLQKNKCRTEFYTKINQAVYERKASNIRPKFLLLMAELQYLKENSNGSSCYIDDSMEIIFNKLSVEHILRESIGEAEVSKDFYESIHKLGNLTLLGEKPNGAEGAKEFEQKRLHYQISPYYITREIARLNTWEYQEYRARQEAMVSIVKRAFEL